MLNEALVYASESYKYSKLFGKEDFKLIKSNPSPNSSPSRSKERFDEIIPLLKEMYLRNGITIPPLNEKIRIDDKLLNVSITNSTDMINLTMGERTGACMRVKGHADSLFRFCLCDKNGFHIKFVNDSNEFISRVSGFRNGNTVFLNQLRYSLSDKYNNEILIKTLKIFSKKIIEETSNDNVPIDNVVISGGYAMNSLIDEAININCSDIKKGLSSKFYSDINSNAIVLATRKNKFTPIKLTDGNEKIYNVSRQDVKCLSNFDDIINYIDRLQMINQIVAGIDISDVEFFSENCNYINEISYIYCGEDWYIAFDFNNNIIDEFVIDRGFNIKYMYNEMNAVKKNMIGGDYEKIGIINEYDGNIGNIIELDNYNNLLNSKKYLLMKKDILYKNVSNNDIVKFDAETFNSIDNDVLVARFVKKIK